MTLYADLPARRTLQVAADVGMLLWVVLWVWVGRRVDDLVMGLAAPGRRMAEAGGDFEGGLRDAGDGVAGVPLVPDAVRAPFDRAGEAGGALRSAGEAQVAAVDTIATALGVVVAVLAILVLLVRWLPARVRFAREATSARRVLAAVPDLDLFALRALARQPLDRLGRVHDDPAGAWRDRDPELVRALATLELRTVGLRPPSSGDLASRNHVR